MIKYLPLLVLLFANYAFAQTASSSCIPVGNTEMIFRQDAYRLAIKRVNDINSPWKDSVEVPQIFVDSIAKALYAIENMEWSALKDTIRTLFSNSNFSSNSDEFSKDSLHIMHAGDYNAYKLKEFSIEISPTANWYSAWAEENYSNTDNDSINNLIKRFGLQVKGSGTFYIITSSHALNIIALKNQFKAISGVERTDLRQYIGGGQYIRTEVDQGSVVLDFYHACGDCPSGCTFGRMWKFRINSSDCSVKLVSASNWGGTIGQVLHNQPYTCIGQLMPVTFVSLKGHILSDKVSLEWGVATEIDIEKYVIERSFNGSDFKKIGEAKATGRGAIRHSYSWLDEMPVASNYYRIGAVEITGEIKYTQVINLKFIHKYFAISIFPNPINGKSINLKFSKSTNDPYFLRMTTITGQTIFTTRIKASATTLVQEVQLPNSVSRGKYFLYISNGRENKVQIVVIQ